MHLVVDIGNTEMVLGLLEPDSGEIEAHWRLSTIITRTADEYDHLIHSILARYGYQVGGVSRAILGSVVPSATESMRAALEGLIPGPVFTVEPGVDLPVRLDVDEPKTVGADRIVNTLAAKVLFQRDTIVVDLGTATTFDCITADGVFVGGVIAPGVRVGLEWLGRRAAKLPRVEFRPPTAVIGRRTETCMESGVFFSTVDAIDGLVDRIKGEWDRPDAFVVGTGGYASLLAPHCRTVQEVEPFLTLKGLFFAGQHLAG
jgi:type III pantothenate kinase